MIDIKVDSRKVKKGDTFIAIKYANKDGHDYIDEAIKRGASTIICERGNYDNVKVIKVNNTNKFLNSYIYNKYYEEIKDLKLIGVTGTNGKTTTCFLTHQMLDLLGLKNAYIGTIGFYLDKEKRKLANTTPDIYNLYNLLLEAKEAKARAVVMECSSIALNEDRLHGLLFDEVAFTNLTQDHLDYHKNMINYVDSKRKLFFKTRNDKISIINNDSNYKGFITNKDNNNIFISEKVGDLIILDIKLSKDNTYIKFKYEDKIYEVIIDIIGKYNVYNYLTSLLLVHKMGYNIEEILNISNKLVAPPGRLEKINYGNNSIFIDYAHTPDAVSNVLENINKLKEGNIITIMGCGGDRDKSKRHLMGRECEKLSDYVIFTNDNPRGENEMDIISDILKGVYKYNHEIILDREEAIKKGIDMLNNNDILMILGKGHEDYQIIGKVIYPFSDKEIVYKHINEQDKIKKLKKEN